MGLIAAAATILVSLVAYDLAINDRDLLAKDRVDWSMFGLVRPVAAFVSAFLLVAALLPKPALARPLIDGQAPLLLGAAYLMAAALLVATATVAVMPRILNETVREGQVLSILTEVAFVLALSALGAAAWRDRGDRARVLGLPRQAVHAALILVVFLILMEEMSWGQHWVGWTAGPMFEGNAQNETNLHNFATYRFEAAYYSAAFLLFVVLPMAWPAHVGPLLKTAEGFVPPRLFALAGLPLAGLLFEEWNVVPYQLWFFMGTLIGIRLALDLWGTPAPFRVAGLAMAILLPLSQLVFVFGGHRMADGYELSEIREFLIACLIGAYGLWLFRRAATAG
ncbi:hypothetical protein ACFFTN_19885 [Aminobacter aganoensis]|uniref:Uncharacterized protein n=1 Tax=Aminobacter aganoensis TaxID=83264 RepID=A0A7X0F3N0_9HYPH|nr:MULTISPECIES: hypothetical protein [Aminobacter]KQU69864.1 hypothetical protein ASC75_06875 [Aminobacter sp. DSM 101952]MBB6352488.1 hypothetical protein [Aminobacter aganoensis]